MTLQSEKNQTLLGQNPIFSVLDTATLDNLCREGRNRRLTDGEVLWSHMQRSDSVALVISGHLHIVRYTLDGQRTLMRRMGRGTVVGISTIAGEVHSADIMASGPTEVLILSGISVRRTFADNPELALRALGVMANLVSTLSDELESLRYENIKERVIRTLLNFGTDEVYTTHQDLADQIGASRANVSRALKTLEQEGMLTKSRGKIMLAFSPVRNKIRSKPGENKAATRISESDC